jgi:hypothetical protein
LCGEEWQEARLQCIRWRLTELLPPHSRQTRGPFAKCRRSVCMFRVNDSLSTPRSTACRGRTSRPASVRMVSRSRGRRQIHGHGHNNARARRDTTPALAARSRKRIDKAIKRTGKNKQRPEKAEDARISIHTEAMPSDRRLTVQGLTHYRSKSGRAHVGSWATLMDSADPSSNSRPPMPPKGGARGRGTSGR